MKAYIGQMQHKGAESKKHITTEQPESFQEEHVTEDVLPDDFPEGGGVATMVSPDRIGPGAGGS